MSETGRGGLFNLPIFLGSLTVLLAGQLALSRDNPTATLITSAIVLSASALLTLTGSRHGLILLCTALLSSFGVDAFLDADGITDRYYSHGGLVSLKLLGVGAGFWAFLLLFVITGPARNLRSVMSSKLLKAYALFGAYLALVGAVNIVVGGAHDARTYFQDAFYYFAPLWIVATFRRLSTRDLLVIVFNVGLSIFVGVATAAALGATYYYGGLDFYALPSFYNFTVFLPVVAELSLPASLAIYGASIGLFTTGQVFAGAKTYLGLIISMVATLVRRSGRSLVYVGLGAALLAAIGAFVVARTDLNAGAAAKLDQALSALDLVSVAKTLGNPGEAAVGGSLLNILSELYVLVFVKPGLTSVFGTGFGSLVIDGSGLLALGGPSAYSEEMLATNAFTGFHLPGFLILHWGGLLGLGAYLLVIVRAFRLRVVGAMVGYVMFTILFTKNMDQLITVSIAATLLDRCLRSPETAANPAASDGDAEDDRAAPDHPPAAEADPAGDGGG